MTEASRSAVRAKPRSSKSGVTKRGSRETQILQVTNPDIDGIAKMVQKGRPL